MAPAHVLKKACSKKVMLHSGCSQWKVSSSMCNLPLIFWCIIDTVKLLIQVQKPRVEGRTRRGKLFARFLALGDLKNLQSDCM
jgi:hypothetical protein